MMFLHPYALLLLLLAIVLVWLHGHGRPPVRREVGTAWLWDAVLADERRRTAWLAWRGRASLAVRLLALLLVAVGAADPRLQSPQPTALLIDHASLAASGHVERVQEIAAAAIERAPAGQAMIAISAAEPIVALTGLTTDRAELLETIGALRPQKGPANRDDAIVVARLAVGDDPQRLLWVGRQPGGAAIGLWHIDGQPAGEPRPVWPIGPLLIAAAVVLLAAEWCLVQRRWLS